MCFTSLQGKFKDNAPYGEYGGWHKAAKVDRLVDRLVHPFSLALVKKTHPLHSYRSCAPHFIQIQINIFKTIHMLTLSVSQLHPLRRKTKQNWRMHYFRTFSSKVNDTSQHFTYAKGRKCLANLESSCGLKSFTFQIVKDTYIQCASR